MTPAELIAALESPSVQAPADVLNEAFALAVGWERQEGAEGSLPLWFSRTELVDYDLPNFLTSIDAVLREMPEGWRWLQLHNYGDGFEAIIGKALDADNDLIESGEAPTITEALMVAILRTKE